MDLGSIATNFMGSAGAAGGNLISDAMSNRAARKERQNAQAWEAQRYQVAAKDMEAAGLNRILALGSPASNVGQADVGFSNAGDSAVAGATAAQNITESQTRKTLNAANEQAAISSARAADEKAKLDAEVARRTREMLPGELSRQKNENTLGGLEVSKQKVLKGLYDKLGPMADKLMSKLVE